VKLELGTTFKIYLPRVLTPAETEVLTPPVSEEPVTGTETLLLVEDEVAVLQPTKEFLIMNGYNVLQAKEGRADSDHNS
jgi:two-component system, cell cycle sensor histidine kinase and response regulator CckA